MWQPWPPQVLRNPQTQPFMANITTWIYMPWDGRYTYAMGIVCVLNTD